MRRKIQVWLGLLFFFFMLPIIMAKLPNVHYNETSPLKEIQESKVAYAANLTSKETLADPLNSDFQALIYFTHSHEAYHPILSNQNQVTVDYHPNQNIYSLSNLVTSHFQMNGIQTDVLQYDTMTEMKKLNRKMYESYSLVRPYVIKQLEQKKYDLVLDLHRDSAGARVTTTTYNDEKYARIAIVVGAEHANHRWNAAYAQQLSDHLNQVVPNISRGVIEKSGEGVDGVYNQDLSKQLLVIELGGVENSQEELNRTIAVLARAISNAFVVTKSS